MKTLSQIILEQQRLQKGMLIRKLSFKQLMRILNPILGSNSDALRTIDENKNYITSYIFEAPRGNDVEIEGNNYDTTQVEEVINLIDTYIKDQFNDVLNDKGNIALIKNISNRKWLIIEMPSEQDDLYSESGFANHMKISSAGGYNWYSLDDFGSAIKKSDINFSAEKKSAAEIKQNQQKWNDWIPLTDFKKGDKDSIAINKIRRLLGITSKNNVFDEKLEIVLKAWQKKNNITDSGKWDDATQEEFIEMLQDTDYENLSISIENHVAFSKPNLDKILGVVVKKKTDTDKKIETDPNIVEMPFRNYLEINSFRKWVRTNHDDFNANRTDLLDATGGSTSEVFKEAWRKYGKEYMEDTENGYKKQDPPIKTNDDNNGNNNKTVNNPNLPKRSN
jgi:hypothetical protein